MKNWDTMRINWFDPSEAFTGALLFFPCAANIFFAFGTPVGALSVYRDLNNNSMKRIKKVFNRSVITEFIIYSLIALCGYLSQPQSTPQLIIDRMSVFSSDIVMTIGKIGYFFTIVIAYIVNYICCKISIVNLLCDHPDQFTQKLNVIVTAITVLTTTVIGCLYANVVDYLSFLGGFLAVILTYMIPTIIHIKSTSHKWYHPAIIFPFVTTVILVFIGWSGAIIVLRNIITNTH